MYILGKNGMRLVGLFEDCLYNTVQDGFCNTRDLVNAVRESGLRYHEFEELIEYNVRAYLSVWDNDKVYDIYNSILECVEMNINKKDK